METFSEPYSKKSSCPYCGDAPINHTLYFLGSIVTIALDSQAIKIIKYAPSFVKNFVDFIPSFLFETLSFFKLVKFSSDIDKAYTFRSRIIWEEAKKRGIIMEQIIFFSKPLDFYRTKLKGKNIYFESIPKKPIIVKPRIGSRGRHTITNINTLRQFREGIKIAGQISSHLVVEEHLEGSVCRATLVNGVLAGFYRGNPPTLIGDGKKTIQELIEAKDKKRHSRVEPIHVSQELHDHILRSGFIFTDILSKGFSLSLSHRIGRLFGGTTKEMIDELHPSFIPILKQATKIVDLPVVGFDCIIPDPTKDANSQKWGIIECNSLPFIDLHYYALEGKPRNIAGMIWDMWS